MKRNLNYLLKYISMDSYEKILKEKNSLEKENLIDNYRSVILNLNYLIKYGITLTDNFIYDNLDELTIDSYFENKIKELEKTLSKKEIIIIIENI